VITIPLPGAYLALMVKKHFIKLEVFLELGKKDKSLLSFIQLSKQEANTELEWEHPWEFKYKDFKYDVLEKNESKDSLFYSCWKDVEETKVDEQLALLVNSNPKQKENNKLVIEYLSKLYFHEDGMQVDLLFFYKKSLDHNTQNRYTNPTVLVEFPPPKV
jgi:hypothetical protein